MRKVSIPLIFLVAAMAFLSCDTDEITQPQQTNISPYKSLTSKNDVLDNLDRAYNKRNFEEFEKLLADDFVFVFSANDYNSGWVDLQEWNRESDLTATEKLLDPELEGDKRVLSIDLTLDRGDEDWEPEPPNDDHPGETWYTKRVGYSLVTKTADRWEHRALALEADFAIRRDEATGKWQIVKWWDDTRFRVARSPGETAGVHTTWGGIKALYQ